MHLFAVSKQLANHLKKCHISLKWANHLQTIQKKIHASLWRWQTISTPFQRIACLFEVGKPSANHFKEDSCISLKLADHSKTISKSVLSLWSWQTISKPFQRRLMHLFEVGKPLANQFKECLIPLKWANHQQTISKKTHASLWSWQSMSKSFQRVSCLFEVGKPSSNHFKEDRCVPLKVANQ